MMSRFLDRWAGTRNMTINNKLMLVIMLTTSTALLLVTVSLMVFQLITSRGQVKRDQEAYASIIGASCVPALDFEQPRDAQLILEGLSQKPSITFAGIYTANQELFAAYRRGDLSPNFAPPFSPDEARFEGNRHLHFQPILSHGELVGTIALITDLAEMKNQLWRNVALLSLVLMFAAFIALLLSSRLRRVISDPILELAKITEAVSRDQDFSPRARARGDDEIGALVNGFNDMLDKIQAQNIALEDEKKALRASEKKYRGIFENATEGIFQVDREGTFLTANLALARMLAFTQVEAFLERFPSMEAVHFSMEDHQVFRRFLQSRGYVRDFETQFKTRTSQSIHVSINAHRVRDEKGKIIFYEGTIQDNSQRIRAEQLAAAKEAAETATQAKSAFLANMSHEIRTPMNAIIGLTNLTLGQDLPGKTRDYLAMINDASHSLLAIINDILDFSKVEAGKLELEHLDFSLPQVFDNLANIFRTTSALKDIELLFRFDPSLPEFFKGDPLRITQVLTNLINNALKFTETGEIMVQVSRQAAEAHGYTLKFQVIDTGMGIPEDKLDTMFESFTQADGSTSRKYGGTGLGLAICRDLVRLMGGHIEAHSSEGEGSVFSFTLTLEEGKAVAGARRPSFPNHDVLLIVGNDSARELLKDTLTDKGFRVQAVATPEEGLDTIKVQMPNLVILDLNYGAQSLDFLRNLRRDHDAAELPFIITATMEDAGYEETVRDAGANAFLIKPVSQSMLLDTIVEVFKNDYVTSLGRDQSEGWSGDHTPSHIKGARLLLVEDNEVNRIVACDLLRGAGLEVDAVDSGAAAIRAVLDTDYDAVLMDIQMPDMDGYQTTEAIRSNPRFTDLPIIAMTAHAMKSDREACLAGGMNDHVSKPIDPMALFGALGRYVAVPAKLDLPRKEWRPNLLPAEMRGIHLPSAVARIGGEERHLIVALHQFADKFRDAFREIQAAHLSGDKERVCSLTHTLKGAAGNISARKVHHLASAVEGELARDESPQLDSLKEALTEVIEAIDALAPPAVEQVASTSKKIPLEPALRELQGLLSKNDFDAEDKVSELLAEYGEGGYAESLKAVLTCLRELDFKTARHQLNKLMTRLEIL